MASGASPYRCAIRVVEVVTEHSLVPFDLAFYGGGVGVEQQLGRVAAQTFAGRPEAMYPQAVALTGADPGEEPVPYVARMRGQLDPLFGPFPVERHTSTASAISGRHREIGPVTLNVCPEWVGTPAQWGHLDVPRAAADEPSGADGSTKGGAWLGISRGGQNCTSFMIVWGPRPSTWT